MMVDIEGEKVVFGVFMVKGCEGMSEIMSGVGFRWMLGKWLFCGCDEIVEGKEWGFCVFVVSEEGDGVVYGRIKGLGVV